MSPVAPLKTENAPLQNLNSAGSCVENDIKVNSEVKLSKNANGAPKQAPKRNTLLTYQIVHRGGGQEESKTCGMPENYRFLVRPSFPSFHGEGLAGDLNDVLSCIRDPKTDPRKENPDFQYTFNDACVSIVENFRYATDAGKAKIPEIIAQHNENCDVKGVVDVHITAHLHPVDSAECDSLCSEGIKHKIKNSIEYPLTIKNDGSIGPEMEPNESLVKKATDFIYSFFKPKSEPVFHVPLSSHIRRIDEEECALSCDIPSHNPTDIGFDFTGSQLKY